MIERPVEFVHSMRAEGVTHLGPVKSNAYGRQVAQDFARLVALHLAVVGDVGKILKPFNDAPVLRVENIGNLGRERNSHAPYFTRGSPARVSRAKRCCTLKGTARQMLQSGHEWRSRYSTYVRSST